MGDHSGTGAVSPSISPLVSIWSPPLSLDTYALPLLIKEAESILQAKEEQNDSSQQNSRKDRIGSEGRRRWREKIRREKHSRKAEMEAHRSTLKAARYARRAKEKQAHEKKQRLDEQIRAKTRTAQDLTCRLCHELCNSRKHPFAHLRSEHHTLPSPTAESNESARSLPSLPSPTTLAISSTSTSTTPPISEPPRPKKQVTFTHPEWTEELTEFLKHDAVTSRLWAATILAQRNGEHGLIGEEFPTPADPSADPAQPSVCAINDEAPKDFQTTIFGIQRGYEGRSAATEEESRSASEDTVLTAQAEGTYVPLQGEVYINGTPTPTIYDSGSSITLATWRAAKARGITVDRSFVSSVRVADLGSMAVLGSAVFPVQFRQADGHGKLVNIRLRVVENLPTELLLGNDVLGELDTALHIKSGVVHFQELGIKVSATALVSKSLASVPEEAFLFTDEDFTIKPLEERSFLPCSAPSAAVGQSWMVETTPLGPPKVLPARGANLNLVDGRGGIFVANLSQAPVFLPKGTLIAKLSRMPTEEHVCAVGCTLEELTQKSVPSVSSPSPNTTVSNEPEPTTSTISIPTTTSPSTAVSEESEPISAHPSSEHSSEHIPSSVLQGVEDKSLPPTRQPRSRKEKAAQHVSELVARHKAVQDHITSAGIRQGKALEPRDKRNFLYKQKRKLEKQLAFALQELQTAEEQQGPDEKPETISLPPELLASADPGLTDAQREALQCMLQRRINVFAAKRGRPPLADVAGHIIDTGSARPMRSLPRRQPPATEEIIRESCETMLADGTISRSQGSWASPVVMIKKPDGSMRFCVDYSRLNAVTKPDSYPLPRQDVCLEGLSGSTWFSSLDLMSGYWQIPMDQDSREKTGFSTKSHGLLQFNVMPFGLTNAPAAFQRAMDAMILGLSFGTVLAYLDDILVHSSGSFEDHLSKLEELLESLEERGFTVNSKKSQLCRRSIKFLGHQVSAKGLQPLPDKVETILGIKVPNTKAKLLSFLQTVGYYRKFIKGFSHYAHRLKEKTKPSTPWTGMDAEDVRLFTAMQQRLISAPILVYPDSSNCEWQLHTDASKFAVSAVLSQTDARGIEHPVGFFSRSLTPAEKKWATWERECLGVLFGLEKSRPYIWGGKVHILTDNTSVESLLKSSSVGRHAHWKIRMSEYTYTIGHRKGSLHGNADGLTRVDLGESANLIAAILAGEEEGGASAAVAPAPPVVSCAGTACVTWSLLADEKEREDAALPDAAGPGEAPSTSPLVLLARKELARAQDEDPFLQRVGDFLKGEEIEESKEYSLTSIRKVAARCEVHHGVIYHRCGPALSDPEPLGWRSRRRRKKDAELLGRELRVFVPLSLRESVLAIFHGESALGHQGFHRTFHHLASRFFWPAMQKDLSRWLAGCVRCHERKVRPRTAGFMGRIATATRFLQTVGMDIVGILPETPRGNRYIVTLVDSFTRWPEAYPVPRIGARTVAECLLQFIRRFGVMQTLITDQGSDFTSRLFEHVCEKLQIHHRWTLSYRPQANGQTERYHRELAVSLSMLVKEDSSDWDLHLDSVLFAHRISPTNDTDFSPYYLVYHQEPILPIDVLLGTPEELGQYAGSYDTEGQKRMQRVFKSLEKSVQDRRERNEKNQNAGRKPTLFTVGMQVFLSFPVGIYPLRRPGEPTKTADRNYGPFIITRQVSPVTYEVKHLRTGSLLPLVHVSRMNPFLPWTAPTPDFVLPTSSELRRRQREARRNARERNAAEQFEAAQAQPEPAQAAGAEQFWSGRKRKAGDMLEDVEARPISMQDACKEGGRGLLSVDPAKVAETLGPTDEAAESLVPTDEAAESS